MHLPDASTPRLKQGMIFRVIVEDAPTGHVPKQAADITSWTFPSTPYPDVSCTVGDTIKVSWSSGFHGVAEIAADVNPTPSPARRALPAASELKSG